MIASYVPYFSFDDVLYESPILTVSLVRLFNWNSIKAKFEKKTWLIIVFGFNFSYYSQGQFTVFDSR